MKMNSYRISASQQGAGLIEVMVSLLILAVGLLGVLSLQANGLNSNQRAVFVTEAQMLAQDMANRILAYGNGTAGVNSDLYGAINVSKVVAPATVTVPSCAAGCDADQTLAFDQAEWQSALSASSLPRARGTVTRNIPFYTVNVMWDQDRTGVGAVQCNSDNCFTLQVRVGP
jgi:type IV pilus assembly protein PilV